MKNYQTLRLEKKNDVLTVVLSREGSANAINLEMMKELIDLSDWLRENNEIRFVVFTNNGRLFSAGYDLFELSKDLKGENAAKNTKIMQLVGHEMVRKLESIEQISIALLRGSAYGGGVAIAMTADFRFIADKAVLSLPETNVGMFLSWGCTPRLVKAVGAAKAKELIMLCEEITAEECYELGIVTKVVPAEKMDDELSALIEKIRSKGQRSIQMTKKLVNASVAPNFGDIFISEPELSEIVTISGETTEKVDEFIKVRSR